MAVLKRYRHILAIDGSTPVCSVVLKIGDTIFDRREIGMGIHSTAIFSQITDLLSEAGIGFSDIEAIVIGIGPGSYTGLRVVASSIKGLLFDHTIPLFGVNSLAGFAASRLGTTIGTVHTIIDARRNHLYHQSFILAENFISDGDTSPELLEIQDLYHKLEPGDVLIGTGIERLDMVQLQRMEVISPDLISAIGLIHLYLQEAPSRLEYVEQLDVSSFEPKYAVEDFLKNPTKQ